MIAILAALVFAMSLCADCLAVSICSSVTLKKLEWKPVIAISLVFGVVQSGLLLLGYGFGDFFVGYVEKIAHIIGFLLLLYVGASMLKEGFSKDAKAHDLNGLGHIIIAAIATSIDALAVGISLSMGGDTLDDLLFKALAVFFVTMLSVVIGIYFGKKLGERIGHTAEILGGIVLILMGINILL